MRNIVIYGHAGEDKTGLGNMGLFHTGMYLFEAVKLPTQMSKSRNQKIKIKKHLPKSPGAGLSPIQGHGGGNLLNAMQSIVIYGQTGEDKPGLDTMGIDQSAAYLLSRR